MSKFPIPRLRVVALALGASLSLCHTQASALGLMQAYQAALQSDPTYRSALFDSEAGKESRVIARAGLLPAIGANYSASQNRSDIEAQGFDVLGRPTKSLSHPKYISRVESISLRQSVLNLEGIARYRQGVAQSNFAGARFDAQAQEVILRVTGAYFDVLFNMDQLALATAERDMYAEQKKVNERLFKQGEGTRTDVLETLARLDLAETRVIETGDNLAAARNTLAALVGGSAEVLDPLSPDFRPMPVSENIEELKELALRNNPELQALQYSVEAARLEISKANSGHAPRVDFIASYSKNAAETLNTYNQESTIRSIGVQVNIPLYQGGQISAVSRQAAASYEKAKADLQARTDKLLIDLRKDHALVLSGEKKIGALLAAVASSTELVQATKQSIKGGVRINLDLLNARQQLFTSQRDLAQARYAFLLAQLRVKSAVGGLDVDEVRKVASYFR